jgi:hypothetical protein
MRASARIAVAILSSNSSSIDPVKKMVGLNSDYHSYTEILLIFSVFRIRLKKMGAGCEPTPIKGCDGAMVRGHVGLNGLFWLVGWLVGWLAGWFECECDRGWL